MSYLSATRSSQAARWVTPPPTPFWVDIRSITAEDIAEAIGWAEGCPFLSIGGGVEVGELTLLNPASVDTTIEDHGRAAHLAR